MFFKVIQYGYETLQNVKPALLNHIIKTSNLELNLSLESAKLHTFRALAPSRLRALPIIDTRLRAYVPLPSSMGTLRAFVLLQIPLCLSAPGQKSLIWLETTMDTRKDANFQFYRKHPFWENWAA